MAKMSFMLSYDFRATFKSLSQKNKAILIDAIFDYEIDGTYKKMDGLMEVVFIPIKQYIDKKKRKYVDMCLKNKENIEERWRQEKDTTVYEPIRTDTNHTELELDLDLDLELDINNTKEKSKQKRKVNYSEEFESFWSLYPDRGGGKGSKESAYRNWKSRLKEGHTIEQILDACIRYQIYCDKSGNIGTEYVFKVSNFLGRDKNFLDNWEFKDGAKAGSGRKSIAEMSEVYMQRNRQ